MPIIFLSSALLILPCCRGERGGARGSRKEEGLSNRPSNRPRKGGEGIEWSGRSARRKINSLGDHRADDGHHPATAPLRWARLGKFCPSLKVSGGGRGDRESERGTSIRGRRAIQSVPGPHFISQRIPFTEGTEPTDRVRYARSFFLLH